MSAYLYHCNVSERTLAGLGARTVLSVGRSAFQPFIAWWAQAALGDLFVLSFLISRIDEIVPALPTVLGEDDTTSSVKVPCNQENLLRQGRDCLKAAIS